MKVLMLGWELPPHNSGGLGVACYQLCRALSRTGVDIEFILPYTADHSDIDFMRITSAYPMKATELRKVGIAYDSFLYTLETGASKHISLFDVAKGYEEAIDLLVEESEFDIIHAHDWLTCRAALRAKEKTGKPLIVHIHSIEADRSGIPGGGNPLVREIESMSMLIADRIIAVSEHTKQSIMREYDIPADKIEVVHNSFDVDQLEGLSGENVYRYLNEMKKQGYRVVTNVGRITIQKGLPNLLRAMKAVIEKSPKTFLLVVGSGEQLYELIALAGELGISDKVFFTDFQRGKNYRDAYAIGDLFVMPSVSEPFGLTPLEAIGYGTPALVSKQSGVSEVLLNVLKVDFWDIDEMVNQIMSVMQNDALRDELHKQSYQEYLKLSWEKSATKLNALYTRHISEAVTV